VPSEGPPIACFELIAEGRLTLACRHRRVLRALRVPRIRLADPPQLVKDRTVAGVSYEDWRPWLRDSLKAGLELAAEMKAIDWGY